MKLEQTLDSVELEIKALKNAFEQTAFQLPVFTYSLDFTTTPNNVTLTQAGYPAVTYQGSGRTVVTFDSGAGVNALAFLEIEVDDGGYGISNIKFRRVPYSGGARWIIYDDGGQIDYKFVVHSAVPGNLGAKMIWQ